MPQPIDLTHASEDAERYRAVAAKYDRTPDVMVCPRCKTGRVKLHVRKVITDHGVRLVPSFLRCTRDRSCGWWQAIDPKDGAS